MATPNPNKAAEIARMNAEKARKWHAKGNAEAVLDGGRFPFLPPSLKPNTLEADAWLAGYTGKPCPP